MHIGLVNPEKEKERLRWEKEGFKSGMKE